MAQGGVSLKSDGVASATIGDDRSEHELGVDARRGLWSQIGDHLVVQFDAEGRTRLGAQQRRAHEELPDGHCQAVRQSRDVCTVRPVS